MTFDPNICSFKVTRESINQIPQHQTIGSTTKDKNKYKNPPHLSSQDKLHGCRLGMDSHADMSCVGRHARILEIIDGQTCSVRPFNDSYKAMENVQTVNAAFAAETAKGETVVLRINQALDFRHTMEHSILCTNQARHNDIIVDDVPQTVDVRKSSTQSIIIPSAETTFPLRMHGPVAFLSVRYPTDYDLNNCIHIDLTDGSAMWDPSFFNEPNAINSLHSFEDFTIISTMMMDNIINHWTTQKYINALTKLPNNSYLTPEYLSSLWGISVKQAGDTLRATTHDSLRLLEGQISRRVKTRPHQRMYNHLSGYLGLIASDTAIAKLKSTRGHTHTQMFANRGNYTKVFHMQAKSDAPYALDRFIHEVGVPQQILTDNAAELTSGEWEKIVKKHHMRHKLTEPHSPWQNPAELAIGITKRTVRKLMQSTNTPARLWDYCWSYVCELRSLTVTKNVYLEGATPYEKIFGYSPNIAELIVHKWYDWVWYHDPVDPEKNQLGRWLGPAHDATQGLAYYILTPSGEEVVRSTVHKLSENEQVNPEIQRRKDDFTRSVEEKIGNYSTATVSYSNIVMEEGENIYDQLFYDESYETECIEIDYDSEGNVVHKPDMEEVYPQGKSQDEIHDLLLGVQVPLPLQGESKYGKVVTRKRNLDGTLKGEYNEVPMKDSRIYEVDFGDGNYYEYSANVILENLYSQADDPNSNFTTLEGIIGHDSDNTAVKMSDGWFTMPGSNVRRRVITTKGWKFHVQWTDGTTTWVPLSTIKESNPVELAEYCKSRSIDKEPAMAWWVDWTLKKKEKIIKSITHRMPKKAMKFGIEVPGSVDEARALDRINGNELWEKAIKKELKNVLVAFKLLQDDDALPVGSKEIPYHIIFDVKFDLTRKARLVAGGHRNKEVPAHLTYSSVASRESVRLAFMLAGLNSLKLMSCDIGNAFLNAPNRERVHVKVGKELFGEEHAGKRAVICRALYGLKSASAAWRDHFHSSITQKLGYQSTIADPDVYRKPKVKADGTRYYSYLVIYVDDVLCVDENPRDVIKIMEGLYRVKPDSIKIPDAYLGMDVRKWKIQSTEGYEDESVALGANTYIKEAIRIAKLQAFKNKLNYPTTNKSGGMPFKSEKYRPELDSTRLCDSSQHTLFQNFIGMLRWACELGRLDILHETSLLSQYLASPRIGHLEQALHIFRYLEKHDRSWMVMDHTSFDVEWRPINNEPSPQERARLMKLQFPDAKEILPHNMPEPLGKPVDINVFVDADHAGNRVTRRSHTGIIIFCNLCPISWYSKRQNTVETSTFSSEIIALRIATEQVEALRYKLRMFGIPITGPARVFCDNESVVKCTSNIEAKLKKKHTSVSYCKIKCAIAAETIVVYYEKSETNLADLLTKVLSKESRKKLIQCILN